MTERRTKFKEATKGHPCPVCGGDHKCSLGADGLISCGRHAGTQQGFVYLGAAKGDEQFHLYRREGDPVLEEKDRAWREQHQYHGQANGSDWPTRARQYAAALTPELRDELAVALGLPPYVLEVLGAGWYEEEGCWTFPERDGAGPIAGILRRFRDGRKPAMAGSKRGLHIPPGWKDRGSPILCVEGPSDTLALWACGLSVVGRPSNTGGVDQLARLFDGLPSDTEIIILGEFDPKPDGSWPGLACKAVAAQLSQRLDRPVSWVLPPAGHKDARAWVNAQHLDTTLADAWEEAGVTLLGELNTRKQFAEPSAEKNESADEAPYRFQPIDSRTFFTNNYALEWLVQRLLVRNQPAVLGGPKKALKTSTLIDLAVSLATATPFLGRFDVYKRHKVVIISGESGEAVLQDCGRRVCAARSIDPHELGVWWDFRLPQVANLLDRRELCRGLKNLEAGAVMIDPLYLCLLAGLDARDVEAGNLYKMGPLLSDLCRACLEASCTPILSHHARKGSGQHCDPLDLDDLSFAGIAEFARQWILENRREPFDPETGSSKLWLSVGGSAGQSGCWAVDVEEGVLREDFSGRKWQVTVRNANEERGQKKDRQQEKQVRDDGSRILAELDREAKEDGESVGWTVLRSLTHLSNDRMVCAVAALKNEGVIETLETMVSIGNGAKRKALGIRRVTTSGTSGKTSFHPDVPDDTEHHREPPPI